MSENNYINLMGYVRDNSKIVDLTHDMEENMPAWPTQARYGTIVYESYDFGDAAIHSQVTFSEHTGTHIDAPKHFIRGGCPIDKLDLKTVMGRGVKIEATNVKPKDVISLEQIKKFENINGDIKSGDIIMLHFGWDEKWALQPDCGEYLKNWPGLSQEAAEYFLERGVSAVGCDTLALDAFGVDINICHQILLGKGIPIIENINNLSTVPVFSYVIGLPNKFKGGSGSPIRMVAFVQENED